ncbi:MAG: TonB-dependent receptor [Bacteroidetes bacterium]|nr:TonB-dependent receptor [Bacteroidota bacterium]MBU1486244.1 TonB-dependent receptor [Bacteroidota bacterium]MBU1759322.1 TonB-dependent receptor [Bacteroidota bacterium]MBU2266586.1 TonB-dependent receptor [Bacteroidota bacterium]
MKRKLSNIIILLFLVFTGSNLMAQGVTTAAMSGVVTDSKGETVPGATVVATHTPTGTAYSTQTRVDGRFNLPNLRVGGPYTVKVTFVGSRDYVVNDIILNLGQEYTLTAQLQDNTVALREVVIVGTQDKVFNSSRTGARETVTRTQIERLPSIGRSLGDYTKLTPSANGSSFGGRSGSYNNVTVDGALFNNSFGLSGSLGGQTNSQPISLDAIEQIQVDIAPYDVRQGFFTGAGVNTVTKSGTNEFKGTGYFFFRNPSLLGYKAGPFENSRQDFTYNTRGLSLGGPIIKNKLFFFVSGEQEKQSSPGTTYTALRPGQTAGGSVSQASATDLDALKQFLITKYNYNPGDYEGYNNTTKSDKVTVKVDWNINSKNTLSAKYFYLKSQRDAPPSGSGSINNSGRSPNNITMPFNGSQYIIHNNFNIGIVELNSRISNKVSNKATVGYTALRDFRESRAGSLFPLVDIGNGSGQTFTAFGYEPFTANNQLYTDTYQFSDDVSIFAGKHEITIGTNNQLNKFQNGFAPTYYGNFNFNSLADFYASANTGTANASRYQLQYSALPDGAFPFANIKISQYSLYAQDKFTINPNFKLSYGIRADYSSFPSNLQQNTDLAKLTFRDGYQINTGELPKNKVLLSPRVGFNYNVKGEGKTQIRGGAGIFTGQVPFVWISNQASNNGVQFGSFDLNQKNNPNDPRLKFSPDVNAYRPSGAAANTQYGIAVTDRDFKLPQIFRINAAVDQKLPWDITATLEGAYTKDINAVLFQNVNLPTTGTALQGSDNRMRYTSSKIYSGAGGRTVSNPDISSAILFRNTNKGYSYFITGQLQKSFTNGFFASIAYTHSNSQSVNDGGSIAQSIWRDRQVTGDPNSDELGYANFYQPNRVISYLSYRKEYAKNYATSIGLTFESAPNFNYSYTYRGDLNGDGQTNDLIYVPKSATDIVLVADNTADTRTAAQIYAQLDAYIKQDPYLSKHRGEVVKRGAALAPYFNQFNFNFTQDFMVNVGGKRNTIRLTADIINLGNLLNRNWGLFQSTNTNQPLSFKGVETATGKPTFSFPYQDNTNKIPYTSTYRISTGGLWQAQLGVRYIFN